MQPLFTIHAGEMIVADALQSRFQKRANVWIPTKDSGIDLLVTDANNRKTVSIQVKQSRCYAYPNLQARFGAQLTAAGWWRFEAEKIRSSPADFWVLLIIGTQVPATHFIIIEPKTLLARLQKLRPGAASTQSHLWVTQEGCWETMGLTNGEKSKLVGGEAMPKAREFSEFLNAWSRVEQRLK